jgi:hypothetical protein
MVGPRPPGDMSRRRLLVAGAGTVVGGAAALAARPAGARAAGSSLLGPSTGSDRAAPTRPDVVGRWFDQITAIPSSYHVPGLTERVWAVSWLAALVALEAGTGDQLSSRHRASFDDAAVATAVHDALVALLPDEAGTFDAALVESLAAIPEGEAKQAGIRAGQDAAARVVDDHDDPPSGDPVTPPPEAPGIYRPPPGSTEPPGAGMHLPRPFVLGRADRFRPGPPPALGTTRYRRDLREVQRLGGTVSERTEHQSDIAWLAPGRQYTPALAALLRQPGRSLRWKVRLLAAYSTAAADAGIAVADAKRTYWHWRPVTAIRLADTDGDPLTHPDPGWSSYLMTPANPEWPSGHGGGAGAAEKVLERFTGPRTPVSFTATWSRGDGKVVTREYRRGTRWTVLTQENVDARVWAGVHFRFSDEAGVTLGRQVAEHNLRRLGL